MIRTQIARASGLAIGAAMVLGFASQASALTIADLQAQIALLMQQLQTMQGGSVTATANFTSDLTVGSTGSQVSALQSTLISGGYLHTTATGYFGSLTKAAVMAWQAASGLPSTGFVGPLSRAKLNGGAVAGTPASTPVGVTTTGVEGVLNVTSGPISNTVINVGAQGANVITVRAQAQSSDISIQRIQMDLGSNTNIYNKIFSALHVVDKATGQVLATIPLNSSTVVQNGNNYIVNLSGFNVVVKAGTYKDIGITADLYSSIDSAYITGGASAVTDTFTITASGVRGTDGAGIDQYSPVNSFSQTVTVNRSLVDNAQAQIAIAPSTPLANSVAVTDTINGQYLQLPIFAFNLTAQNDALHLHNLAVTILGTPASGLTTATVTAVYLYNGSTQVASASVATPSGVATFSNITDGTAGATVNAGQTTTFTVKADVTGVLSKSINVSGSYTSSGTTIYNSQNSTVTATGSAAGNIQTVLGAGPVFTLISSSITKGQTSGGANGISTSTLNATFNIQVQAVGASVLFPSDGSTTPLFTFGLYNPNTITTTYALTNASTTSIGLPSTGVTIDTANKSFTLPQNNTVVLPVTFQFVGNSSASVSVAIGNYAVGLEKIQWVSGAGLQSTTYTSGQVAWRSNSISLP